MELIDRQAAIDAVEESRRLNHHKDGKEACAHEYEHRHFLKLLMDLPSAQPEPCEDAVSRQEVADILENADPDLYVDLFNKLPSVTPKQRTGKWISADAIFGGVPFYCSECGENTRDTVMGKPRWNFCPNCGAKMEVTE